MLTVVSAQREFGERAFGYSAPSYLKFVAEWLKTQMFKDTKENCLTLFLAGALVQPPECEDNGVSNYLYFLCFLIRQTISNSNINI